MNYEVKICEGQHYHGEHYYDLNTKWCPGFYRELADAIRSWNHMMDHVRKGDNNG